MTTTGFGMVNAKMGLLPVSIGVKYIILMVEWRNAPEG